MPGCCRKVGEITDGFCSSVSVTVVVSDAVADAVAVASADANADAVASAVIVAVIVVSVDCSCCNCWVCCLLILCIPLVVYVVWQLNLVLLNLESFLFFLVVFFKYSVLTVECFFS